MEVKSIGIVGTGVIGASWAAFYLSRGFDVRATDPADGAEGRLRDLVASYWPTLEQLGLSRGASRDRLTFGTDICRASISSRRMAQSVWTSNVTSSLT